MTAATTNHPFVFSPGSVPATAAGTDPLVHETRREIADIVREVAAAVGSQRTADEFLSMLVDRILRAMAAQGVLVWQRSGTASPGSPEPEYQCIRQLGRITADSIPNESTAAHRRMLVEVATDGQPVVVPATPGARDPDVPANPMDVPAALVAIKLDSDQVGAEYLLEVFLEPNCGVATQRGYLRFVAQMSDLAGEFLRIDQLRSLKRREELSRIVDAGIRKLHEIHDCSKLEAATVDLAAELFGFDRVGLCPTEPKVTLAAVSHVCELDTKSPAAIHLCEASLAQVDEDGCYWHVDEFTTAKREGDDDEEELFVRAVVRTTGLRPRSLVCCQSSTAAAISDTCRSELVRFVEHADIALNNVSRLEAIPGGRLLSSLMPAIQSRTSRVWTRIVVGTLMVALLAIAAFFPVPLVVYSNASIRPAEIQTLSSPRDAIVQQVHVRHGQQVAVGDTLLTMVDPSLEEEITALVGRRAVLLQQRTRWTEVLVDSSSNHIERMEQVQGERSLVDEEIQSIDSQLSVLSRVRESLIIRAGRKGTVDAWQIEQRLQSRPLKRGDPMLQVVASDSPWVVDVQVPQSRIAHIQNAEGTGDLSAQVSLESAPEEVFTASLSQIGPAVAQDGDAVANTSVLLELSKQASNVVSNKQATSHQSGAPARVMFRCGTTPAGYLLFQDLIRSVRGNLSLYFAGSDRAKGSPS